MSQLNATIAQCESAIARNPEDIAALNQLAMLQSAAGNHNEALRHISSALKLAPSHPLLHYNLGQVHGSANRYEDEIKAYQQAIALKPDFIEAHVNMGVALRDMQRFDQALEAFKQALHLNPDHAGARTNRAQTNLILGNYEHGWREYEWRWQDGHQSHDIQGPRWNGKASLKGKRLLIHAEQGLGDTIQFVRYLDLLNNLGATIILRVQPPLKALLETYDAADLVIDTQATLPAFDFHIPLLSLPHVLYGRHPGIALTHHYLHATPEKVSEWAHWIAEHSQEHSNKQASDLSKKILTVGLCWSGSTHHLNDKNRSMLLEQWGPILDIDCIFIALQKEIRTEDQRTLASHPEILNAGSEFKNFQDTAGLLCNLDLVISVDTSVAHLSAALGIPTWILLPEPADWRWLRQRSDSPWYPSVKLFRQSVRGEWASVLSQVSQQLSDFQTSSGEQ